MNRSQRRASTFKRAQRYDRNARVEPSRVLTPILMCRTFDADEAAKISIDTRLAWHRLTGGVMQSRTHSFIESLVNVALGMVISMALQIVVFPAFGHAFTLAQNVGITIIFTFASIVRSYVVRRWFNAALHRAVLRVTAGGGA